MENQIQAREKATGNIMTPPHTVLVSHFKGKPRRVRIDLDTYDPKQHGEIVANSEQQHFGQEVAAWKDELHARAHASDTLKRATGLTDERSAR